jgi:hypothetical protein
VLNPASGCPHRSEATSRNLWLRFNSLPARFCEAQCVEQSGQRVLNQTEVLREAQVLGRGSTPSRPVLLSGDSGAVEYPSTKSNETEDFTAVTEKVGHMLGFSDRLELVGLLTGAFLILVGIGTIVGMPWTTLGGAVGGVKAIAGLLAVGVGVGLGWLSRTDAEPA